MSNDNQSEFTANDLRRVVNEAWNSTQNRLTDIILSHLRQNVERRLGYLAAEGRIELDSSHCVSWVYECGKFLVSVRVRVPGNDDPIIIDASF